MIVLVTRARPGVGFYLVLVGGWELTNIDRQSERALFIFPLTVFVGSNVDELALRHHDLPLPVHTKPLFFEMERRFVSPLLQWFLLPIFPQPIPYSLI